jgi:hypothetical protein
MLTYGALILHGNARYNTDAGTEVLLEHFSWELFDYSPYSRGLNLKDCQMFSCLKEWLRSQRVNSNIEMTEDVETLVSGRKLLHTCINPLEPSGYYMYHQP